MMLSCIQKLSAVVLLAGMLVCAAGAETWQQNTPFYQGYEGYHTFRIPSLIAAADGTVLAFAEGRKNSSSDTGDIDLVLRRSLDHGQSWQPMQIIWNDGQNTCGNPTPVVDRSNGRVWLFMTHNLGQDSQSEISAGTSDGVRTIWSCFSDDHGLTWSAPVNRFSEVQSPATRWDATGPGNGIQIEHGSHVGRLVIPAHNRNIQSDDHGQSWVESAYLPERTGEGAVVEIHDGVLFRNDRATGSRASVNCRIISTSYGQGSSWTAMEAHPELVCPICQGSTVSHVNEQGQRRILFSNPAATTRVKMTVKVSHNNAVNWPVAKLIYKNNAAYSSLACLADGTVGLLYENGDGWPYHRISYARFSMDWLYDATVFFWDFEAYQPGQTIPAGAGVVQDARGYALHGTANKSMAVADGSPMYLGGSAVHFDGSGQRLRISDAASKDILDFDADESFLIRIVFRTEAHDSEDAGASGALAAKDVGTGQPSWWLRIQGGKLLFFADDGKASSSVTSSIKINDGDWHEVLAVRNASLRKLQLYVDGHLCGQNQDKTTGSLANGNDVVVGSFNAGTRSFFGDIDRVQVVRGVLPDVVLLHQGDLNGDFRVDMDDLVILLSNWIVLY
ncbi:MAG: exo-alpha-sialidase [Anaerohalosphaeraceae bacterium]